MFINKQNNLFYSVESNIRFCSDCSCDTLSDCDYFITLQYHALLHKFIEVKTMLLHMDDRLYEDMLALILSVFSMFSWFQPLVTPNRVLVGEGILIKMCRKKPKPRQFFLFNDILVYGNILISKKKVCCFWFQSKTGIHCFVQEIFSWHFVILGSFSASCVSGYMFWFKCSRIILHTTSKQGFEPLINAHDMWIWVFLESTLCEL